MDFRPITLTDCEIADKIRLVHISDLHFNKIDQDKKNAFESDIKALKPHIIVITGDLVDSPWSRNNFDKAKEFVDLLQNYCSMVIIAPGNHEKLWKKSYKRFSDRFSVSPCCCYYLTFKANRNVVFFVFDSTSLRHFWSQRGKITKNQLNSFKERINFLRAKYVQGYERSFKIVALHHHPLPTRKHRKEELLYLKNAGEFIESLTEANIDMVLHGHKHDPVDYSFQWNLRHLIPQPHMVIISAGTLLKKDKEDEKKSGFCEKTNYYILDLTNDQIEGFSRNYNYDLKEFVTVKRFLETIHFPPLYKYGSSGESVGPKSHFSI